MNEIQAVKTAKIEEVKKNSKKGFTLVELVVVIAILAILAAIAIPVVASTIKSSQVSSAKSNAQTVELAIKEAKSAISSGDNSVFANATSGKITLAQVAQAKKIESAMDAKYNIGGKTYVCAWDEDTAKVYYVEEGTGSTLTVNTIDSNVKLKNASDIKAITSKSTTDVSTLKENNTAASTPVATTAPW